MLMVRVLQWEMYFVRGAPEALAMTQAALLGQTFAMLSGVKIHSLQKIIPRLIDYMTESETHCLISNLSWDAYCSEFISSYISTAATYEK